MANSIDQYPEDCPFCNIATNYPSPTSNDGSLLSYVPEKIDVTKTEPSCFLVLTSPNVLAFLDILPMTEGHLLVVVRDHRPKVEHMEPEESRDVGFWLPLLAKAVKGVTGVADYNIVQNNGIRAAQVVPHVHFHIIPRPGHVPELKNKSWTMFGRGQREDLDDDEAEDLATRIRLELRKEIEQRQAAGAKL